MRVTSAQRLARLLAAAGIEPSVVGDGQVPVGPDVVIEPPSIDEAVVAMTRGPEPDRRSARSAAELAEKH